MTARPLLPILRSGVILLVGVVLLYRPRRAVTVRPTAVPAGYVVDVSEGSAPPPPGGHRVPTKPFPGQVVPDGRGRCPDPDDVVISGACWAKLAKQPHPVAGCGDRYYRSGDGCYAPVMKPPRTPSTMGE